MGRCSCSQVAAVSTPPLMGMMQSTEIIPSATPTVPSVWVIQNESDDLATYFVAEGTGIGWECVAPCMVHVSLTATYENLDDPGPPLQLPAENNFSGTLTVGTYIVQLYDRIVIPQLRVQVSTSLVLCCLVGDLITVSFTQDSGYDRTVQSELSVIVGSPDSTCLPV